MSSWSLEQTLFLSRKVSGAWAASVVVAQRHSGHGGQARGVSTCVHAVIAPWACGAISQVAIVTVPGAGGAAWPFSVLQGFLLTKGTGLLALKSSKCKDNLNLN